MRIQIWHNVQWSPYKADVFSSLWKLISSNRDDLEIYHVSETDNQRVDLSEVNQSLHNYPHSVLFKGSYDQKFPPLIWGRVLARTIRDPSDVTIIAGYHRFEYWLQAAYLAAVRRPRAVFCDSTLLDQPQTALKRLAKCLFFKLVPNTLSYGTRAREHVLAHGVSHHRARIRVQAAHLPSNYNSTDVVRARGERTPHATAPVFLYVGRLSREKNLDALLAAFDVIWQQKPNATLRLIGSGPDKSVLQQLAANFPSGEKVIFGGAKTGQALFDEYLSATALVLPSKTEPWGLVVNEALHFGCPVVVSDRCGCVPELVAASSCGIVFAFADRDGLAKALERAIAWAADPISVAHQCLERVAPYTPEVAAHQILKATISIRREAG